MSTFKNAVLSDSTFVDITALVATSFNCKILLSDSVYQECKSWARFVSARTGRSVSLNDRIGDLLGMLHYAVKVGGSERSVIDFISGRVRLGKVEGYRLTASISADGAEIRIYD